MQVGGGGVQTEGVQQVVPAKRSVYIPVVIWEVITNCNALRDVIVFSQLLLQ